MVFPLINQQKIHGVPEPTLRWRMKHDLKQPPTFNHSSDDENQIAKYAEFMNSIGHPCSVIWLRQLAGRLASKRFVYFITFH